MKRRIALKIRRKIDDGRSRKHWKYQTLWQIARLTLSGYRSESQLDAFAAGRVSMMPEGELKVFMADGSVTILPFTGATCFHPQPRKLAFDPAKEVELSILFAAKCGS